MLDGLERAGAVDDAAFARLWVDGRRGSRGLSGSRLRRELADRGVPDEAAEAALASIDGNSDRDVARALAEAWVARHGMTGDRDRARLFGYLARRGYGPDVASASVRAVSSGDWDGTGAPDD